MSARARTWHRTNSFHHSAFTPELIAERRTATVSVCLPARDEAATIGAILERLLPLRESGVVDQVVVVDDSSDGTAEIARGLGAEVHDQSDLMPELGPVLGKGDAMWRALPVLKGEIVCFVDADSERFGGHFACGLVGPLVLQPELSFVKGYYRRPFRVGSTTFPDGGGRVTELTARPLLEMFYPALSGIEQPLAGEIAARRELLERLPFATGYGVDIGLLLDAYAAVGLDGLAQVDLDVRQNAHQPLRDLGPMASAVLSAVTVRLERDGRLRGDATSAGHLERPPRVSLRAAA
jgi:glucosyl-3-phosphoglycerate synthase